MFRGLKIRFIVFLVLILSLVIGVSFYLNLRIQYTQLMEVTREKLDDIATTIEKSIASFMEEGRTNDVKNIIESVGTLPDLEKVRLFSTRGKIVVSSDPEEVGEQVDPADMKIFHDQNFSTVYDLKNIEQPVFYVIKPILNQPSCFPCHGNAPNQINGVLEVDVSMATIRERLNGARKLMITTSVVTLLALIASILFLLAILVDRPIQGLIRTIRKAKSGDLSARVDPADTQEFAELGENFNAMISRLETAQTNLKRFHEQQMERADRFAALGELAAGIAHEIKNPIAGISGAIQVLTQDCQDDDPRREIFQEILVQIDRVDKDIKDLLSYARMAQPELAEKNINVVLRQAIFLIKDRAAQKNVKLDICYDPQLPPVQVDEKQIQQVLVNLCLNAIQAMPEGGTLTICMAVDCDLENDRYLEIQVIDTGKGIPPEQLEKIFTPFFTTRHTGTGLGLSISQKIIHQHQGELSVSSVKDSGTCFVILLPLDRNGASETGEE